MNAGLHPHVERLIDLAIEEDVGPGDLTTSALIPPEVGGRGRVVAREEMILSGVETACAVFRRLDPDVGLLKHACDGDESSDGETVIEVSGSLRSLLTAERTALNFLQRLSGIATTTRRFVRALGDSGTRLLDTRKTAPGWRLLEKKAVRHGGGGNHRMALFDGVLIKDNHLAVVGDVAKAVRLAKERSPALVKVEVEVESIDHLLEAIEAGADIVMLDNMNEDLLGRAVEAAAGRVLLEASGGITLERLPGLAKLGLDYISCGAVTHSAVSVDLSFDLNPL